MRRILRSVGQRVVYNNVLVILLAKVGYKGLVVYEIQDAKRSDLRSDLNYLHPRRTYLVMQFRKF